MLYVIGVEVFWIPELNLTSRVGVLSAVKIGTAVSVDTLGMSKHCGPR